MSMTDIDKRLNELSAELQSRGVVDVKFTIDPDCTDKEAVKRDLVKILEAHLAGEGRMVDLSVESIDGPYKV